MVAVALDKDYVNTDLQEFVMMEKSTGIVTQSELEHAYTTLSIANPLMSDQEIILHFQTHVITLF